MRTIVVDGYNLIFQFPELRKMLERDLEQAREDLLIRLGSYAGQRHALVVVFDGDGRVPEESYARKEFRVIFSKPPEKADQVIKELIEKSQSEDVIVVSSDREIVDYARLHGVKTASSRQFAHEMSERTNHDVEKKFDHPMSQEELKEWMRLFRGDDCTEGEDVD